MKLDNGTVFVLDTGDGHHAFNTEDEAIGELKSVVGNDTDPGSVAVFQVNLAGEEEWSIEQVPWSTIAVQMMQGD